MGKEDYSLVFKIPRRQDLSMALGQNPESPCWAEMLALGHGRSHLQDNLAFSLGG